MELILIIVVLFLLFGGGGILGSRSRLLVIERMSVGESLARFAPIARHLRVEVKHRNPAPTRTVHLANFLRR